MDVDLIAFLEEGPKIGEVVFRDKFGYCPRRLLRDLVDLKVVEKYKEKRVVAYRLVKGTYNVEETPKEEEPLTDKNMEDLDEMADSFKNFVGGIVEEVITEEELEIVEDESEDMTFEEVKKKRRWGRKK